MLSKYAPKRTEFLIQETEIQEPLVLIDDSDDYYITPTAKVYRKYPNGFYPRKTYTNTRNGYEYITIINKKGEHQTYRLHRLVALAYLPNPNDYPIVGHKDNVKTNCDVSNLYWTTYSENIQKAVNDKLLVNKKGYEDSQSIPVFCYDSEWNMIKGYGSISDCHKQLGISKSTIVRHCQNKIKTHTRTGYYFQYQNTLNL